MGQIPILTKEQTLVLDGLKKDPYIPQTFYFTGGTALSKYYLKHRYSEDVDLFTEKPFNSEFVLAAITRLQQKYRFTFTAEHVASVQIVHFQFSPKKRFKVDFNHYPYKRIEPSVLKDGIYVDSLLDIAVNKLLTVTQREDVKDFVDLYFLEPTFGIWDLLEGVRVKFRMEVEPWLISTDLLKVEEFNFLPRMIKPLTLAELKRFFRSLAKELGKKAVE